MDLIAATRAEGGLVLVWIGDHHKDGEVIGIAVIPGIVTFLWMETIMGMMTILGIGL